MTDVDRRNTKTSVRLSLLVTAVAGLTLGTGCPDPGTTSDGGVSRDMTGTVTDMPTTTDGGTTVQPLGCSKDGWCWQFPAPQGNGLLATWGSSAQDVWAVGGAGTIVHFDGVRWSIVRSPTNNTLYSIWGSSSKNVFAVGDRGTVLRWDGSAWTQLPLGTDGKDVAQLYGVWGGDGTDVWFVGNHLTAGPALLRWNGTTISRVLAPATVKFGLRGIWGTSKTSIYAAGESGTLLRFDGSAWTSFGPPMSASWAAISGISDNNFFVATRTGLIYRWTGTGTGWVLAPTNPSTVSGINGLWSDGTSVFAVGDIRYPTAGDPTKREGMFLKWDGTSFNRISNSPKVHLSGAWGTSGSDVFVVGVSGTTGRYDGSVFTTSSVLEELTGNNGTMYGLSSPVNGTSLAVGDSGGTLRGMSGAWLPSPGAIGLRLYSVTAYGNDLLSVGYDFTGSKGQALRWSGSAWSPEGLPTTSRLLKITTDGTNAYAVGDDKTFLVRSGGTWKTISVPILQAPTLRDVYAIDSKNIWIVGGGDKTEQIAGFAPRVLVYDGTSVLDVPLPVTDRIVRGVWGADANNVWVVGDGGLGSGGLLLRWNGGSKTWTDLNPAANPIISQGLRAIWGRSATDIYAVGNNGLVLHFDGTSWNYEQSGTDNNLVSVSGSSTESFITGTGGTILRKSLR